MTLTPDVSHLLAGIFFGIFAVLAILAFLNHGRED